MKHEPIPVSKHPQLYHLGVLTTGGTDDKDAVLSNTWQSEQPVGLS